MQKMSKHSWAGALVLVTALWWAAPMPVHATPFTAAVEYGTSAVGSTRFSFTFGYQFSMSNPFTVDALAYWNDGAASNHQVGLWDSGGTLLVSTTVLNTDPIQGHFHYHSIPTFPLGSGTYTIGGTVTSLQLYPQFAVGVVTVPGFTWIKDQRQQGAGLNYPTVTTSFGYGQNGVLDVNFSIVPTAAVPESSTLILLAAGLAGLVAWRWKHAV